MKLHSPKFERALKRGAKAAIRRSPELKREARRARRAYRKHYNAVKVIRMLIAFGFGGLIANFASRETIPVALALLNIWALVWMLYRAQALLLWLYQANDLAALSFLPVEKPVLFRWEFQKFFRAAIMSLLDSIAGFAGVALYVGTGPALAAALPAAILSWGVMLAAALFCASRWPRFPYGRVMSGFVFAGWILLLGSGWVGKYAMQLLERVAVPLNVLLPTGWAASVYWLCTGRHEWTLVLLLVPCAALLSTVRSSLQRLRANYDFTEVTHREASDLLPDEAEETFEGAPDGKPLRVESGMVEEIVRKHLFSPGDPWHQPGWLEKRLWDWLSPRERVLAEFVFPAKISLSGGWKRIFRNMGIAFVVSLAVGLAYPGTELWVLGAALAFTTLHVAGQFFYAGVPFRPVRSGGVNMPFYAGYGLGFWELSRLLLKCAAVQAPFLLLYSLIGGGFVAYASRLPVVLVLSLAVKGAGLLLALRCVLIAMAFSSGSNDTSRIRIRSALLMLIFLICAVLFVVFAAGGFFEPSVPLSWGFWLLAVADAWAFLVFYGWCYNRNWFDLIKVPNR